MESPRRARRVCAERFVSVLVLLLAACAGDRPSAPSVAPGPPVVASAAAPEVVETEWDRELPRGWQLHDLQDQEDDDELAVIPVRVVDDVTGDPLAGARIDNWDEADTPHAEPWSDLLAGSWTTDRDGWALVPSMDRAPWYYVEAPGHAPHAEMAFQEEYRLVRGADFTVEVRDWLGRPAANAVVDFVLGCGHTANARCETTDARGRIVLRCIEDSRGDLWIRAAGIAGRNDGYGGWYRLPVLDGIRVLYGDPSPTLEGLVLRADGSPAAGARVGSFEAHRGPWTTAGPDGRWRLTGAWPFDTLVAMAPADDPVPPGFEAAQTEFRSVPGAVSTVRLPAEGRRRPTTEEYDAQRVAKWAAHDAYERGEEPEPAVPPDGPGIRVRVKAADGVVPFGRVRFVAVRDGDGAGQATSPLFRDGVAARSISAGPGTWTVTAGEVSGALRPESRRVEVGAGWTDVEFTLAANPVWKPRVVERLADGTEREIEDVDVRQFEVVSEKGSGRAAPHRDERGEDGAIHVPASGPFVVKYGTYDPRRARVLLDGPPQGAGPTLVLHEVPGRASEDEERERPRDLASARLRVFLPDGRPAAGWTVTRCGTAKSPSGIVRGDGDAIELDDDGAAECAFDRGSRVEAQWHDEDDAAIVLPLSARIDGPGPWTVRWPAGTVEVRAVDETGAPLPEFAVSLRGWHTTSAKDGAVRLRGVGTDPLRLWVGAEGRRLHDLRLVLAPGEARKVTVRMRPTGTN